jgi:hypothetical protein
MRSSIPVTEQSSALIQHPVTEQSSALIQHLLATQPLATQVSIARQAFELGLATLAAKAEQPREEAEPDLTGAQRDLEVLQQAHALVAICTDEVSTVDTGKATPEPPAQLQPAPPALALAALGAAVEDETESDFAELLDSL